MPNNTDISPTLLEDMQFDREISNPEGKLYTLPPMGTGEQFGSYLYRSMTLDEAKNWFKAGWLPTMSGIPWSTDWEYSRKNYLKGDSRVQLEIPAHDMLRRMRDAGARPKYEGLVKAEQAETWGVGPKSETGRSAGKEELEKLLTYYSELEAQGVKGLPEIPKKKGFDPKKQQIFQNQMFAAAFKDKVPQARVVARVFSS